MEGILVYTMTPLPVARRCSRCSSHNVRMVNYQGIRMLICQNCGYYETITYDEVPVMRSSQKAKGQFSPYKAGGSHRAKK